MKLGNSILTEGCLRVRSLLSRPILLPQGRFRFRSCTHRFCRRALIWNNCEHFARWCKTGEHESEQVNVAVGGAGSASTAVTVRRGFDHRCSSGHRGLGYPAAAGTMSGLATVGALVGGGAVAGIGLIGAAPATVATVAMQVVLRDDDNLSCEERGARNVGRIASAGGAAVGTPVLLASFRAGSVAGLSAAGITSGIAAIRGVVGGGMAAGLVITTAAPAVSAGALGYGVYRFAKWMRSSLAKNEEPGTSAELPVLAEPQLEQPVLLAPSPPQDRSPA